MPESDREGGGGLSDLAVRWYTQDIMRLQQIKTSPLWLWSFPGDLREKYRRSYNEFTSFKNSFR